MIGREAAMNINISPNGRSLPQMIGLPPVTATIAPET